MLSVLIFLPLLAAAVVAAGPRTAARMIALVASGIALVLSCLTLTAGGAVDGPFHHIQTLEWLPNLGVQYKVGVDGASGLLTVLTAFLGFFAICAPAPSAVGREKLYYGALLATIGTTIGAFVALDLVLFYVFFEACLVPVYFLIGTFGGKRRQAAGTKFFLYTVVASLVMLVGIFALFLHTRSFDYVAIRAALVETPLPANSAILLLLAFATAFAVKSPLFPFHTWQADAYAECPTGGVVLLAGALAKLGTYGFYRYCIGLFPDAAHTLAPVFVTLAVCGIIYGALVAAVQTDVKRLIAYSSLSHIGFVILGLFSLSPIGMSGALLQNINHGVSTGAMFLIAGMIEQRTGTRRIGRLGGLWSTTPLLGRLFLIVTLSSVALPLTNGFVGEFLILLGAFQTFPVAATIATTGVIWSAVYLLWMFQRVMYGPPGGESIRRAPDADPIETTVLAAFVVLIFVFGVSPKPFLKLIDSSLSGVAKLASVAAAPRSEP